MNHRSSVSFGEPSTVRFRAQYRREVCNLLSSYYDNDPIAKEMEIGLGKRAILHDKSLSWKSNAPSTILDMRLPTQLIHCNGCGAFLQQSNNNSCKIRIKAIKRGRTRRRRASRRRASRIRMENRRGKNHYDNEIKDLLSVDHEELEQLSQITDGTCKNIVVQTCTYCDHPNKTKGTLVVTKRKKIQKTLPERNDTSTTITGNEEFISINTTTNNREKMPQQRNSSFPYHSSAPAPSSSSSLSMISSSKKKKKKKVPKKQDLASFLSRLNDF